MDGVLKSWAVTRGPSLVAGEKRLAVAVEDHPLDYGDFEGTIPKGEYGGGAVIIWDRGAWTPIGDARKGYAKGHLDFELHGEKLKGRWHLVRMRGKPREKRENWLLIKGDDEFARAEQAPDILAEQPKSVDDRTPDLGRGRRSAGLVVEDRQDKKDGQGASGAGAAARRPEGPVLDRGRQEGAHARIRRTHAGDADEDSGRGRAMAA